MLYPRWMQLHKYSKIIIKVLYPPRVGYNVVALRSYCDLEGTAVPRTTAPSALEWYCLVYLPLVCMTKEGMAGMVLFSVSPLGVHDKIISIAYSVFGSVIYSKFRVPVTPIF